MVDILLLWKVVDGVDSFWQKRVLEKHIYWLYKSLCKTLPTIHTLHSTQCPLNSVKLRLYERGRNESMTFMQVARGQLAQLMWSVYLIYLESVNANEECPKYGLSGKWVPRLGFPALRGKALLPTTREAVPVSGKTKGHRLGIPFITYRFSLEKKHFKSRWPKLSGPTFRQRTHTARRVLRYLSDWGRSCPWSHNRLFRFSSHISFYWCFCILVQNFCRE